MQSNVTDFKAYKRAKGIALPRSPYYTLAATGTQIREAYQQAAQALKSDSRIQVVHVGYKSIKTGHVKLFKGQYEYSSMDLFERWAGIRGHYVLALARKGE